jgi:branched-chain amino acid transport system permease protein
MAAVPFSTTAFVTELAFTGLIFVMLGVSWNLLAGYAGQISLGHAAFFGIGAFVSAWLTTPTRAGLPESLQMPVAVALVAAAVAAGLLALVTGPVMFRLSGHYFAIGTLALAAIIQLLLLDQRSISGGSTGYYVRGSVGEDAMYLVALAVTVAMVLVTYRIVTHSLGLGMRAVHGDEQAASSLGVDPLKYKMYAFVISSLMAGLAGGTYAQFTLYVNPESTLGVVWMIDTLVVVILGGMGTMVGPILGAGLFLLIDNGLRAVAGGFATTVEGALIILFIVFAPAGLYGVLEERYLSKDDGDGASVESAPEQ